MTLLIVILSLLGVLFLAVFIGFTVYACVKCNKVGSLEEKNVTSNFHEYRDDFSGEESA